MIDPRIVGMIMNATRGGQWRAFLGIPESKYKWLDSDPINATAYMLMVYYMTSNLYLSIFSWPAMLVGAMLGWGTYIGALGGWVKTGLNKLPYVDFFIRPLRRWPRWWGFVGLTIRGALWGAILSIPFFCFGYNGLPFIYMGATMGICYIVAIRWTHTRIPTGEWQGAGWGLGEIFFGYPLWGALSLVVESAKLSTT